MDNPNEPIQPDIVLFGLMDVNLGPFKILPKRIPPMSEDIQINNITNKIILKWISLSPNKQIIKNKNKYIANMILTKNWYRYLFLKKTFDNLVNSTNDKEKILINTKR